MASAPGRAAQGDSGGAAGLFSSLWGGPSAGKEAATKARASESKPEDIPKEDLLHLCMKMNKRMQTLEAKCTELTKKHKDVLEEKRELLDIIRTYVTDGVLPDEEHLDLAAVRESVMLKSVQEKDKLKKIEARLESAELDHSKELAAMELKMRRELSAQASKLTALTKLSSPGDAVSADESVADEQGNVSAGDSYLSSEIDRLSAENERLQSTRDELQLKLQKLTSAAEKSREKIEALEKQVVQYEISSREKAEKIEEMGKLSEKDKMKAEERILYLQMQLNAVKSKEDIKERELLTMKVAYDQQSATLAQLQGLVKDNEINTGDYREVIKELHSKISELEGELIKIRSKETELEKNSAYTAVLKAEQEAIVSSLRRDLKQAMAAREDNARRCAELEEYRVKAEAKLAQFADMAQAVEEARDALEEREARLIQLQSEAKVAERNHALRTAMLATAESHISTLKSDLEARDANLRESLKKNADLQRELAEKDAKKLAELAEIATELQEVKRALEDERLGHTLALTSLREKHAEELDQIKKDHAKKSATARALITEKDGEIKSLQAQNIELREEIASGAHNERRIFELAQQQSRRDVTYNLHSDTRELAFQQIQHTLATRDLELAKLQASYSQLVTEANELRRVARREGVNMDYLKNVVIQYMVLPTSAPERNALVPVIGTLLQLSKDELRAVQAALKAPLWASLPVKEVKRGGPIFGFGNSKHAKDTDQAETKTSAGTNSQIIFDGSNGRENKNYSPPSSVPIVSSPRTHSRSPPNNVNSEASKGSHNNNPLLDRSDTDEQILVDGQDTPEIHM